MKGFTYFSGWLIEGRQGILKELEVEFRAYDKQLEAARRRVAQLELELRKWRSNGNDGGGSSSGGGGTENTEGKGQGSEDGVEVNLSGVTEQPGSSSSATKLVKSSDRGHRPNLLIAKRKLLEPGTSDGADSKKSLKVPDTSDDEDESPDIIEIDVIPAAVTNPPTRPSRSSGVEDRRKLWTPIVESCVRNCDAGVRKRSLELLTSEPVPLSHQSGLLHLVCNMVRKGQQNSWISSQLLHALKLLESLLNNPTVKLKDHTTYMTNTIFGLYIECRPTSTEDWEVLDFGAILLGKMAQMWGGARASIMQLFSLRLSQVLEFSNGKGLTLMALYNTIQTLKQMGSEAIATLVRPNIRRIGERLRLAWESASSSKYPEVDRVTIEKIKDMIVEITASILVSEEGKQPETLPGYEKDFGKYFGKRLLERVQELRLQKGEGSRSCQVTNVIDNNFPVLSSNAE